jgi:hypothetical protein
LFLSQKNNHLEDIKKEVLEKYFHGNVEQFNIFLTEKQKYEILGTTVPFISERLKGTLGHHTFIKFKINDSAEPLLIEWGLPSDKAVDFSQKELRETTGEQLINMLVMHRTLYPLHELSLKNIYNFTIRYKAGITDCHTYIDKVLLASGEPESHIERFTPNDTFIGRFIGSAIRFFSPLPQKLHLSEPTNENNQNKSCDYAVR